MLLKETLPAASKRQEVFEAGLMGDAMTCVDIGSFC